MKWYLNEVITNKTNALNDKATLDGLNILMKLINNILKNPNEEKFRTIKKSNKTIQAKVMSL